MSMIIYPKSQAENRTKAPFENAKLIAHEVVEGLQPHPIVAEFLRSQVEKYCQGRRWVRRAAIPREVRRLLPGGDAEFLHVGMCDAGRGPAIAIEFRSRKPLELFEIFGGTAIGVLDR